MIRVCHFDPFGGVTAETLRAALADAGAHTGADVPQAIASLGVDMVTSAAVNIGAQPDRETLALLEGRPVFATPDGITNAQGVAILTGLASAFGPMPAMKLLKSGHAPGLRVILGERSAATESTIVTVIETNIDDTTAEVLGFAMERLMSAGALDVSFTPMQMKKNRPATLLRVIARPEDQERLAELIFAETSTAGMRLYSAERRVRARRFVEVDLGYGKVRIKVTDSSASPEFDDCRSLALTTGKPIRTVFADALRAYNR